MAKDVIRWRYTLWKEGASAAFPHREVTYKVVIQKWDYSRTFWASGKHYMTLKPDTDQGIIGLYLCRLLAENIGMSKRKVRKKMKRTQITGWFETKGDSFK